MMTSSNGNIFRVAGPLCGEFTGHLWIPRTQRPMTRSFLVFFDLRLNERLSKQSWGCWFETPTRPLWRQRNDPGHFLWKDPQATKRHWWWITTGSCNGFVLPGNKTLRWPMFIKLHDAIWWRHQMETFFALLALCEGNPPVTGGFPSQKPVRHSFEVFFDLRLNKRLSKQSRPRWFETPSRLLWITYKAFIKLVFIMSFLR